MVRCIFVYVGSNYLVVYTCVYFSLLQVSLFSRMLEPDIMLEDRERCFVTNNMSIEWPSAKTCDKQEVDRITYPGSSSFNQRASRRYIRAEFKIGLD